MLTRPRDRCDRGRAPVALPGRPGADVSIVLSHKRHFFQKHGSFRRRTALHKRRLELDRMPPSNRPDACADGCLPHPPSAAAREDDPLRQLFRRHANHFSGARAQSIHRRIKDRLFTDLGEQAVE
jgi:hypothetical protein